MKFALESKQVTLPSEPEVAPTVESISEAYEGLLTSYMELSDAQRNMDEVCQVMENIDISMRMVKIGGIDAIKLLNADKSLESLVNVTEEKLTVQSAEEGLGDAAKQILNKFVEALKTIVSKLLEWMASFGKYLNTLRIKWFSPRGTLYPDTNTNCLVPPKGSCKEMYAFVFGSLDALTNMIPPQILQDLTDDDAETFDKSINDMCNDLGVREDGGIPSKISDDFIDNKTWRESGYTSNDELQYEANHLVGAGTASLFTRQLHQLVDHLKRVIWKYEQPKYSNNLESIRIDARVRINIARLLIKKAGLVHTSFIHYCAIWGAVFEQAARSSKQ